MRVKSFLKQIRNRLFLNAIKNAVREVVRDEVGRLVVHLEEWKDYTYNKGRVGYFIHPRLFRKSGTTILSSTAGITAFCTAKTARRQSVCSMN